MYECIHTYSLECWYYEIMPAMMGFFGLIWAFVFLSGPIAIYIFNLETNLLESKIFMRIPFYSFQRFSFFYKYVIFLFFNK